MGIEDEKSPGIGADLERSSGSDQEDLVMYTGQLDAKEYGTLKREYSLNLHILSVGCELMQLR